MDAALADITAGVAEGFAKLLSHVSAHVVSPADVVAIRRLLDTAELICTRTVAGLVQHTDFTSLGHRDVSSWLSAETGARRTEGAARCAQAKVLDELADVNEAVLDGSFSVGHLRALSAAVTPRRLDLAKRDQSVFINAAAELDATQFSQLMQRWMSLADDALCDPTDSGDGSERDKSFDERRLQLSRTLDGSWRITGLFDPLAGEAVEAMLASVVPAPSPGDPRTPTQRRADGFTDFCKDYLSRSDRSDVGNERPNVNLVLHAVDGSAHTTGGWYVRNWQLSQVLCDATFTAVAATLKGAPFDVGTPTSSIPARNRKAVVVRDRTCRFPHCGRHARWCEIHHIRERMNGGTHELPNLVLLCTYHHREVHRRGITLTWKGPALIATLPSGVMLHGPLQPATTPSLN